MADPQGGPQKKVDEGWKAEVEREKRSGSDKRPAAAPPADFALFLSSLGLEAYVALGEVAHPETGEKAPHLEHAQYLIDVLGMLEEKTRGNLTQEEAAAFAELLYGLRMKFVEKKREAA